MAYKNIILLSDGTGNSAAKPFKTNVWRLYQAIDINPPPTAGEPSQIAFYDDGVGTENFKPLALMGLGFGLGLARNIKDLYTYLCRNYKDGDSIYLFGFSRGAFTVRVLSGLILRCGLVQADNETELNERVEHAYDQYQLDVARRATATDRAMALGWLLGGAKQAYARDCIRFDFEQKFPEIAFIGVWDTVDAYGMPIDEIKLGIDKYLWPMTLADRKLSQHVERACQALSLDDERPTFRPVIWDESAADPDRLTQIWFSGVHANVGGGYPDDGLAHVALQWIMDEARAKGMWFYDQTQVAVDSAANPHGEEYDSRSGLAGYYRYGPRIVDRLCNDTEHDVKVQLPKVYYAAMNRIWERQKAYAPVGFPSDYAMMIQTGMPPTLTEVARPETASDVAGRNADMELAFDAVTRRRIAYFSTVGLTTLLVVMPLQPYFAAGWQWIGWLFDWVPAGIAGAMATAGSWLVWPLRVVCAAAADAAGWIAATTASLDGWLQSLMLFLSQTTKLALGLAKTMLWSWATLWVEYYEQHPLLFLMLAALLAWLFVSKSGRLQDEVFARADYAWRRWRRNAPPPGPQSMPSTSWTDPIARFLRKNRVVQALAWFVTKRIVPLLFALVVAVVGIVLSPFFLPKFYRQMLRQRRYRRLGSPDDTTPVPRIPRSPRRLQPDAQAQP